MQITRINLNIQIQISLFYELQLLKVCFYYSSVSDYIGYKGN